MKYIIIVIIFVFNNFYSSAQNGFIFEYSNIYSNSIGDVIISDDGSFYINIGHIDYIGGQINNSSIIELSSNGNLSNEYEIFITDSVVLIYQLHLHPLAADQIIAIGIIYPLENQAAKSLIIVFIDLQSGDFSHKTIALLGYQEIPIVNSLIDPYNSIIISGSVQTGPGGLDLDPFFMRLDLEGNLINLSIHEWPMTQFVTDLSTHSLHPLKYGLTIFGVPPSPANTDFYSAFDSLFNLTHVYTIPIIDSPGNVTTSYINNEARIFTGRYNNYSSQIYQPSSFKPFSNLNKQTSGNHIDIAIVLTDNELVLDKYLIIGSNDTIDYQAPIRGSDHHQDYIFNAFTSNVIANQFPFQSTPSWIVISKLDMDLNIIWQKYFGGDAFYYATAIRATLDGGCIVNCIRYDPNIHQSSYDAIVFKTNADGLVSTGMINKGFEIKNAILYPNPGTSRLYIQTGHDDLAIHFYNTNGSLHFKDKINRLGHAINTASWPAGAYLYQITKGTDIIDSGKWIKAE